MLRFEDLDEAAQLHLEKGSKAYDTYVFRSKLGPLVCSYFIDDEKTKSFSMESGEAILTEEGKKRFASEDYIIVPKGTFDKTKYKRKPDV